MQIHTSFRDLITSCLCRREMDLPPYSLLNGSSSSNLLGGGGVDMAGNMATQWEPQQEGGGLGMQVH